MGEVKGGWMIKALQPFFMQSYEATLAMVKRWGDKLTIFFKISIKGICLPPFLEDYRPSNHYTCTSDPGAGVGALPFQR